MPPGTRLAFIMRKEDRCIGAAFGAGQPDIHVMAAHDAGGEVWAFALSHSEDRRAMQIGVLDKVCLESAECAAVLAALTQHHPATPDEARAILLRLGAADETQR